MKTDYRPVSRDTQHAPGANPIVVKVIGPDHDLWSRCERLEYDVFLESGYIRENPQKRLVEYDRYIPRTRFIAAFAGDRSLSFKDERPVGTVRLISSSDSPDMKAGHFPTLDAAIPYHDEREIPNLDRFNRCIYMRHDQYSKLMQLNPRKVIDISAMVISREKRDANASIALIKKIITRVLEDRQARYAIATIDSPFYNKLKQRNLPWEDLGRPVVYWGSQTSPALIDSYQLFNGLGKTAIPFFRIWGMIKRGGIHGKDT